jgi:hypothetical protein
MSGLEGGEVDRPSILKSPFFPLALVLFFLVGGYAAWVVYNSPIVRITGLWMLGALAVYCFATGGGMYNIIRGMPLYYRNQQGKLIWWMEVRGYCETMTDRDSSAGDGPITMQHHGASFVNICAVTRWVPSM